MIFQWLAQHWFQAAETLGVVSSVLFASFSLRETHRTQKISNLFTLTHFHHELYGQLFDRPELRRVFRDDIDLVKHPITEDERLFMTLVILHADLALEAMHLRAIIPIEGLDRDLAALFRKPIPKSVWAELRPFQNRRLVNLIDSFNRPAERNWRDRHNFL